MPSTRDHNASFEGTRLQANEIRQFPLACLFRVGQECTLLSSVKPLHIRALFPVRKREGGGTVKYQPRHSRTDSNLALPM